MSRWIRLALMTTVVGLVGIVGLSAALLNPPGTRTWLVLCALVGTGAAVQAVSSEPRELIAALILAILPVIGLASEGSPAWLGLPFAALLLVAGELTALAWEGPARKLEDGSLQARLREAGSLALFGLGASVVVSAAGHMGLVSGTWAVVIGALGIVGVAQVMFPASGRPRNEVD